MASGENRPLSALQSGAWVQHRRDPGDTRYHTGMPFRIRGHLDRSRLEQWWRGAIARHDAMRIVFGEREGVPYQRVLPGRDLGIIEHDVRGWEEDAVDDRIVAVHNLPQALQRENPFALHLFHHGPDDVTFFLRGHHIVVDLGTEDVLLSELRETLAGAPVAGEAPSYLEFLERHADLYTGAAAEKHAEFWERGLAGAPNLELPIDHPRTAQGTRGSSHGFALLDAEATARLRALCKNSGSSVFRVLFSAYLAFLHGHTGQDDLVVAVPADCRLPGFESVVGNCINLMVLRNRIDPKMTFDALASQVSASVRATKDHRGFPFPLVVERLSPPRTPGRAPIVQTTFNVTRLQRCTELEGIVWPMPGPRWKGRFGGLAVEAGPPLPSQEGHFELGLTVAERSTHIDAELKYDAGLFEPETIARFAERLRVLIDGVLEDPTRAISELPRMPSKERQLVQVSWATETAPFDATVCHAAFEARTREDPNATAVVHGEDALTYAALDARANRLAHVLVRLGVGPDVRVAIYLPRSIDVIVAMLAVLKAGGAFLPLDPAYPADRIAFMLDDATPACVITCRALAVSLPGEVRRLSIDELEIEAEPAVAPERAATARSLAYVIYTSGSTGRPKGVLVEHGGVCNLAEALARQWTLGPGDRLYCFASFSFDAAIADIFPSLGSGATLHLGPHAGPVAGAELHGFLRDARITHVTLTPSVWATLPRAPLPDLRVAVSAGEACAPEIVETWAPGRTFFNNYGPTEITVCATTNRCVLPADARSVGRPMSNVRIYVLDETGQPVPVGVTGELYVGGAGVARGYLNRSELSAERFLDDPFVRGGRMYRTGDLVRWLPAGGLEYLGRRDTQVKLRGHRIELSEIESLLRRERGVGDACALVHGRDADRAVLVAYVTPSGQDEEPSIVDPATLRASLASELPEYMVPARIVVVGSLPLTTSGKVDRADLAARPIDLAPARHDPPRGELEVRVAGIWAGLLRLDRPLSREEDFYAAGGDSLLALVAAHEIGTTLGRRIPPDLLPSAPTLEAFCRALQTSERGGTAGPSVVSMRASSASSTAPNIVFLPPAGRDVDVYAQLAERLSETLNPHGVRAELSGSIGEMGAACAEALEREHPRGRLIIAGWSMGGVLAMRVARELEANGRAVSAVLLMDAHLPAAAAASRIASFLRIVPDIGPAAELFASLPASELETVAAELAALPRHERARAAWAVAHRRGLTGLTDAERTRVASAGEALAARMRAHVQALETHEPDVVSAKLAVVWARHTFEHGGITRWGRYTTGAVTERVVEGDHYSLLRRPSVEALARAVEELVAGI